MKRTVKDYAPPPQPDKNVPNASGQQPNKGRSKGKFTDFASYKKEAEATSKEQNDKPPKSEDQPQNTAKHIGKFSDFASFKKAMNPETAATESPPKSSGDDCWVDSDQTEKPKEVSEKKEQSSHSGNRGGHRGRGKGRGGKYEEPREHTDQEKLKIGRAIHGRKRGGHHDQKNKATKKYNAF